MSIKKLWIRAAILIIILIAAIARSSYGTRLDSFANDEPYHLVSGAYYVQTGDYRLNPEHPPLSKLWVGLWNMDLELRPFEPLKDKFEERKWLQEIVYYDNDDHQVQRQSRWGMYSFHFILGLIIAILLWHIFGFSWALICTIWFALEPTISAHQPIVLTDLPLAYCLLITALTAAMFVRKWSWKWMIAFGVSFGMTVASKHSALPGLASIVILVTLIALGPVLKKNFRPLAGRFGKLILVAVFALLTLWATYGFQNYSSEGEEDNFNRTLTEKIEDLNSPTWKGLIGFMERSKLLPRAYIWGLADTVRAGVEGRGDDEHLFFGKVVTGRAPYLYFPARILTKVPLGLLLMSTIAMFLLFKALYRRFKLKEEKLSSEQWITIAFVFVFALAHMLALASGRTSYGGLRHALPAVAVLGVLSGGMVLLQNKNRPRMTVLVVGLLFLITFAMTIGEKRIYEYHNELVGGTKNAYRSFYDEGLNLGQRFFETEEFFNQPEVDKNEDVYLWAWFMYQEHKAAGFKFQNGIEDIEKEPEVGIFEGYFIVEIADLLPWPNYDPSKFDPLETKKRIGNVLIMKGRMQDSSAWASSMTWGVRKYLRFNKDPNYELAEKRLKQATEIMTWNTTPYVVYGNVLLKLGKKEEALAAYKKGYDNLEEDDPYEAAMINHMELVKNTDDVTKLEELRPMDVE